MKYPLLITLILLLFACRPPFQPPEPQQPSHLQLAATEILGATLTPCEGQVAVSAQALVRTVGLEMLSGPVRREADAGGRELLQTYLAELNVDFKDGAGTTLWTGTRASQIPEDFSGEWVTLPLSVAWDGVVPSAEAFSLVSAGPLQIEARVSLLRVSGADHLVAREEELQTAGFIFQTEAVSARESCLEWVRIAAGLGKGPGGAVLVHGTPAATGPQISWRKGRPLFIFANLGPFAGGTLPLDAVKHFLASYPRLFGILNPAVKDSLQPRFENLAPDNTRRLILDQQVELTRIQGGSSQTLAARVPKGRLNAVFDSNDELVLLAGRFLEDLPLQFMVSALSEQEAQNRVQADLASKGLATGRTIGPAEEIIFGNKLGSYRPAYLFSVGKGNATQFPNESPQSRRQTFDYTVAMQTGEILEIRPRTLNITVNGRVRGFDTSDPAPIAQDIWADQNFTTCPPPPPHAQPALRGPNLQRQLRINNRDSSRDPFVLDDSDEPTGVTEEVYIDPDGDPYEWPRTSAFALSLTDPVQDRRAVRAMTAYHQVQSFWDRFAAPLLPAGEWDLLTLVVDDEDMSDPCTGGQYDNDDEISLPSFYPNLTLYGPAHEAFHHFDHTTADLENGEDHRMPDAIKEGTASFIMQVMSPYLPDNSMGTGTGALLCLWTGDFQDCMEPWRRIQRAPRIVPTPSHRPLRVGHTDLSAWPDCRTPEERNLHCMFARRPTLDADGDVTGADGQLSWEGQSFANASGMFLVTQILLDAWESGASLEPDLRYRDVFPEMVVKAFSLLDDQPSLGDLRDCLLITNNLFADRMPANAVTQGVIRDAFERHGIDATIDQFCADEQTEDLCH